MDGCSDQDLPDKHGRWREAWLAQRRHHVGNLSQQLATTSVLHDPSVISPQPFVGERERVCVYGTRAAALLVAMPVASGPVVLVADPYPAAVTLWAHCGSNLLCAPFTCLQLYRRGPRQQRPSVDGAVHDAAGRQARRIQRHCQHRHPQHWWVPTATMTGATAIHS